jgi:hypothetical protein
MYLQTKVQGHLNCIEANLAFVHCILHSRHLYNWLRGCENEYVPHAVDCWSNNAKNSSELGRTMTLPLSIRNRPFCSDQWGTMPLGEEPCILGWSIQPMAESNHAFCNVNQCFRRAGMHVSSSHIQYEEVSYIHSTISGSLSQRNTPFFL